MQKFFAIAILLAYLVLLYYIVYGKRKKENQKRSEMYAKLIPGAKFIALNGICGTVISTDDKDVIAEICCEPGKSIKARFIKGAVKEIVA